MDLSKSCQPPAPAARTAKTSTRRRTRVKDLIAQYQHDETLCRYKNKLCLNLRARKRRGGLHTFCEVHREAANRNQRRLDQRKRIQKRQLEAGLLHGVNPISSSLAIALASPIDCDSPLSEDALWNTEILSPLSDTSLELSEPEAAVGPCQVPEPSSTPVPLKDEDLYALRWVFAVDETAKLLATDGSMDATHDLTIKVDPTSIRMQWA